jgi:aryl carrier-like protein
MDKAKTEKLTNQQLAAAYSGRPQLATNATAEEWSRLFEHLVEAHSVKVLEWDRKAVDDSNLMVRFYDLLMEQLQAEYRRRGVHLDDRDISLLGVFNEADFERAIKKAMCK